MVFKKKKLTKENQKTFLKKLKLEIAMDQICLNYYNKTIIKSRILFVKKIFGLKKILI